MSIRRILIPFTLGVVFLVACGGGSGGGQGTVGGDGSNDLIPASRRIVWNDHVGVEGGIPTRTQIRNAVIIDGAHGDGTDTSDRIQQCLDNTPPNGVAYLPPGTYTLKHSITIGSNRTLRGAGPDATILLAGDLPYVVMIGNEWASPAAINLVSGYVKDSSQLVLSDASAIKVGSYVRVDELNDPELPVTIVGAGVDPCTWCGRENGTRARGQIVRVTAKNGNAITILPSMYFTFKNGNLPQVQPLGAITPSGSGMAAEYAGIEDLTIRNNWQPDKVQGTDGKEYSAMKNSDQGHPVSTSSDQPITGASWEAWWAKTGEDGSGFSPWQAGVAYDGDFSSMRIPLMVTGTANCWARNIHIDRCGTQCIQLYYDNYRFEIRDSLISNCINRWDSNMCYGTLVGMYNSGVLIENNIFDATADGPMLAWGASGNVAAYNYIHDAHRTFNQKTWFTANGASHHGAHTSFNLWEGNELESVYFDSYWGSHSHNTLFRNRVLGAYMVDGIADAQIQAIYTISTEKNVRYQNYLGNVLGMSGYHDVYESNRAHGLTFTDKLIYRTGYPSSGDGSTSDPNVFNSMFRHMNFDFATNSTKYCDDAGEPGRQGSNGSHVLPLSLYLSSKPGWWGNSRWPSMGPDLEPMTSDIPAKQRYKAMVGP